ncbi:purine-nucleoside phosphorylase [Atopobacter sp. AH10]|uniref:purine-nucleoside phosphorylase n=1 Tax=Atopobacter sp. AH10 TaxID=2315861 RepID=UPI000EF19F14|nr:purine-nucleoside phosphorylase [Atopobacter sp. AH10]RLK63397.1 purine-nucleoside phosphorylase [Atopobacter sp. AH10]
MSTHIGAEKGQIASRVLFPGDPLRAKFIAENYLTDAYCYNDIRNMFGYTGLYKGESVSVQASGMGIPSAMIYANELFKEYGVNEIIRVGSAGAMQENIHVRDIVLAQAAVTDSSLLKNIFNGQVSFSPIADFDLLYKAYALGQKLKVNLHVGNVLSSDRFYNEELDKKKLADYGVLAVEMEAAGLYTLAAQYKRSALAILTISDHLLTAEETTAKEREKTFLDMVEIALNL